MRLKSSSTDAATAVEGTLAPVGGRDGAAADILRTYLQRTPLSARLKERALRVLPGGSTRTLSFWLPHPLAIQRGEGPQVWDVDGNRYVDLVYNGLSLIHGHAYPPVESALQAALGRGTAWLGTSLEQLEFAELLCRRLPTVESVRFTNTGTEAAMLAMKVARRATGRPLVLKAWGGYHGSFDDLEAGLDGQGELPGRTALARFGDLESFAEVLSARGDQVAAVVLEPMMFTGAVQPPPPGFLTGVQELARRAGALFVLDDCLMLRLAVGGSAEHYGLDPDLTFLGKFLGGGLPVGAVGGRRSVMRVLDPHRPDAVPHGGSFNGHLLGVVGGAVAMGELTADRITAMNAAAACLRGRLLAAGQEHGVPLRVVGEGSVLGVYVAEGTGESAGVHRAGSALLHLAALNHGVLYGPGGEVAVATVTDQAAVDEAAAGLTAALADVAAALHTPRRHS